MEKKLGILCVLGGLTWSCVTPSVIDKEGLDDDGSGGTPQNVGVGGSVSSGGSSSGGAAHNVPAGGAPTSGGAASVAGVGGLPEELALGGYGGEQAGSICPFDGALAYDPAAPYPFCHGDEIFSLTVDESSGGAEPIQNRCRAPEEGNLAGLGRHAWSSADGSPDGESLNYCLCLDPCETSEDCPSGDSGTAQAACWGESCHLSCDDGETCPDGMTCTQGSVTDRRVCVWGSRGEGCDTSEWPSVSP